ncbi:hypothetical protein GJ496_008149 [Pomphorhynchus laevis]|nr:hypothetical protein GJ496_008149 [Pomphorhynchus laevis]
MSDELRLERCEQDKTLNLTRSPVRNNQVKLTKWMTDGRLISEHLSKTRYSSVDEKYFNSNRVRSLQRGTDVGSRTGPVLYWMVRDQRIEDNWAAIYAQMIALRENRPLVFCYCLPKKYLDSTYRQYHFLLSGLKLLWNELKKLNIPFEILSGSPNTQIPTLVKDLNASHLITDFLPIRPATEWVQNICESLPKSVQFDQVDAHNIVPCWVTSDHQEYAARTIRSKIHSYLKEYLTEFPAIVKQAKSMISDISLSLPPDWDDLLNNYIKVDRSVLQCEQFKPGSQAALDHLASFLKFHVNTYHIDRNDPTKQNGISNLSPWIHFGHLSMQRCILIFTEIQNSFKKLKESIDVFIEESVIRRELSDNFCFYQPYYDSVKGAANWAKTTLDDHKKDERQYVYKLSHFEHAQTHDELWNAAQLQLLNEGKIHGFMRMYWAKKILEWSQSPEKAVEIALYLNDKYSLDGCDPNGYVGVMWSICGIHDRAFADRPVLGKIRPMTYNGCSKKFDIQRYIDMQCKND